MTSGFSTLPAPPPPPPTARPAPRPPRRLHPGVFAGIGLAVLGLIGAVAWFVSQVPGISDDIDALERATPGRPLEFEVDEAVGWTLFIEPSSASQSGVRFRVVDRATGDLVELRAASSFSYQWFGRSGRSVARADIAPGAYALEVEGDVVIAIGASPGRRIAWAFGGAALIGVPLVVIGIAVGVVSAVRDTRRRTRDAEPPAPSPWSAGEWPTAGGPQG